MARSEMRAGWGELTGREFTMLGGGEARIPIWGRLGAGSFRRLVSRGRCKVVPPRGGVFLLRLESTTVVCFVRVTAIPVSAVLRLEVQWLVVSDD